MSDPIQVVPTAMAVPRVTPVRHEPPVEPARKTQTDNRSSNERRDHEREAAIVAQERHMSITHDEKLKTFIYRSVDADSGDVVWQYPAEEMLRRAEFLRQLEERREERAHALDERA
jgi:uncharacterized FlaG/YvyC family protein